MAYVSPPIHDISTDVEYAPAFEKLLPLRKGASNGPEYDGPKKVVIKGKITTVAELQKLKYPDIKTLGDLLNPHGDPKVDPKAILFWRAFERAKSFGWNIVAFDEKTGRIEATDTTLWFGFTDDIVVRVQQAGALARQTRHSLEKPHRHQRLRPQCGAGEEIFEIIIRGANCGAISLLPYSCFRHRLQALRLTIHGSALTCSVQLKDWQYRWLARLRSSTQRRDRQRQPLQPWKLEGALYRRS